MFNKKKIPFILLESRDKIESMHGSHITLFPNSLKVLNQLNLLKDIEEHGTKLETLHFWNDEKYIRKEKIINDNNNNKVIVIKRSDLMFILWKNIDQDLIKINKKVENINQYDSFVKIYCEDGSEYICDFVIGADGAWSITRKEMYRHIKEDNSYLPDNDNEGLKSSYVAISISTDPLPHIVDETCAITYTKNNKVTSYFLQKDKSMGIYIGYKTNLNNESNISRWKNITKEDIIKEIGNELTPFKNKNNKCYTLKEFIDKSNFCIKVNLEDKMFETWYYKNIVIIGDAAHKMLPWIGQGANQAIEDVVALINSLNDNKFTNLNSSFGKYVSIRKQRASHAVKNSEKATKILLCENILWSTIYKITIVYKIFNTKQPWEEMIDIQPTLKM
jgi:2-polyprenyl-6-methoxyphenol hydroxylase-like FAD-dependent oxidoreductase